MIFDVIIIGGGPAGITAGIYAKRAGRSVAIIEKYMPGGQLNLIGEIENYTGFKSISGAELAMKFYEHAKSLDIPFFTEEVVGLQLSEKIKTIKCRKNTYQAYSVILALGSHPRELKIDGEEKFKGKGVSYCALCDGNFFKNKSVAVVGSGDSAVSDALYLADICSKVFVLTKEKLKLHNYSESELASFKNISVLKGAYSKAIEGENKLEKLVFVQNEKEKEIDVDGIFVAIGRTPDTDLLNGQIELNEQGYIKSDANMRTSQEGVFVCGDVREGNIKQIACAVGDGAIAGTEASKYAIKTRITSSLN